MKTKTTTRLPASPPLSSSDLLGPGRPSKLSLRIAIFLLQCRKLRLQVRIFRKILLNAFYVALYSVQRLRHRFHVLYYEPDLVSELGRDWRLRILNDQFVHSRQARGDCM